MAWKNISQNSLADGLIGHHEALEELDDVEALIDQSEIERLFKDIHDKSRGTGLATTHDVQGAAAAKRVLTQRPGVRESVSARFIVSPFYSTGFE